jgi:hypothetical protein
MATRVDTDRAKTIGSRETKAAIKYLTATGSTAISIFERDGACQIRVGHKIDPDAHSVHWLRAPNAIAVSRKARKEAGLYADVGTMINALCEAAAYWNETLTAHDLALQRAADAIKRLDSMMEALRAYNFPVPAGQFRPEIQVARNGIFGCRDGRPKIHSRDR